MQHAGFVSQALSLEGHCVEAEGFALPSAARRLAEDEEPGLHGSEAGGRGRRDRSRLLRVQADRKQRGGRHPVSCTTRMPCRRVMRAAGQRATAAR
jgi:hypothetical protein